MTSTSRHVLSPRSGGWKSKIGVGGVGPYRGLCCSATPSYGGRLKSLDMPVFKCITALYFDVCPTYVFPCCISGDASRECVLCDARRVRVLLPKQDLLILVTGPYVCGCIQRLPLSIMILLLHKKSYWIRGPSVTLP